MLAPGSGRLVSFERPTLSFKEARLPHVQAIHTGVAEVKIDAVLNAAGASIPLKVARTVELQRAVGSGGS
jgi:hypothetical protein